MHFVEAKTNVLLSNAEAQVERLQDRIMVDAVCSLTSAETNTEQNYQAVFQYGQQQLERTSYQLEALGKEILGISPYTILNRGFSIVRNLNNIPIVSVVQARQQTLLTIEFRDGIVTVKPTH